MYQLKLNLGTGKMAQQLKVLATKLDNLSSIPRNYMVEEET